MNHCKTFNHENDMTNSKIDVELIGTVFTMSMLLLLWLLIGVAVLVSPGEIDSEKIVLSSTIFFTGGVITSGIIFVVVETFEGK
jgi:uncharacterized membrane protein|tara:strand:+ start:43 stop:294 length:252 start_codon:yes stop_codon:yes gene_type:complete